MDPKSVFCAFFKQGLCKKGDKCKFSHDPSVERKAAKRNLYEDERDKDDNMDDWDDDKLAEVVNKKHGSEKSNQTDIVRLIVRLMYLYTVYLLLRQCFRTPLIYFTSLIPIECRLYLMTFFAF